MPKAGRIYLQLDVHYQEDARIIDVSPLAELLYIRCLCACKRLMTDGTLTNTQIIRLGLDLCDTDPDIEIVETLTKELVDVGLLEGDISSWLTVRSWADWNKPADEIQAVSAARSAAGREGGLKSGAVRRETKQTKQTLKQTGSGFEANEPRLLNTETETETETETSSPRRASAPKPKKVETPAPDHFEITPHLKEWAVQNNITVDLEVHTQNFLDTHAAKGHTFVDWNRAWMTWMRNRNEWDKPKESKPNHKPYVAKGASPLPPEDDYGEDVVLA